MRTRSNLILSALCLILAALFSQRANAQSTGYLTNSNLTGVVPGNTYQFGAIDNINLGNGAVNLQIPLFTLPGRGITGQNMFIYSSKFWILQPNYDPSYPTIIDSISWIPTYTPYGFFSGTPGGLIGFQEQNYYCEVRSHSIQQNVDSNFTYTDGTGAPYEFPNRHVWNSDGSNPNQWRCPGVIITDYDVTTSNAGTMRLDTTNFPNYAIATMKNGLRNYLPYWSPTSMSLEDTNGNFTSATGGDTIKRQFTETFSYPTTTFTTQDSNGNVATYKNVRATSEQNLDTSFPSPSCGGAPFIQFRNATIIEIASLSLPNGWTYGFTYDPNYGELTEITLPSGGYIKYTYTTIADADNAPQGFPCAKVDSRRVATRTVNATGNSRDDKTWTYTYSGVNEQITTVTDPDGNNAVHTFSTGTGLQEVSTVYEEGSTPIKTVNNTWASDYGLVQGNQGEIPTTDYMNWRITQSTTTLNDTSQVNETQTTYDSYTYTAPLGSTCASSCTASYMNPLQVQTYDYGSGAPGNLLQRAVYTYLYSNSTYLNLHMMSQATSKVVYDSASNQCKGVSHPCSQTTYEYDNYTSGITASGAVQHDSTFNTGYTTRGNVTASEQWRSTDGSLLTTRNQYDDAGNIISSKHPNQVLNSALGQTTYSYADSWGNTVCVPSGGNAAAYLTKITNALGQSSSSTYNSCMGTVASSTDVNSQTTTLAYDQMKMNRVSQQNFPDGGQTIYTYNDTTLPLSITSTQVMSAGQNLVNATVLDGLGRISETQVTSATPHNIYTDSYYDGVGHLSEVTNPYYYGSSSPTDGNTQYQYDVLDRVTKVIAQDGGTTTTSYSGNCATSTDPVGNARKRCTDGIGRLTQVFEDPVNSNYETDYAYDALDDLIQVQQKGGTTNSAQWRTRTFTYDSLSELLCSNNPEVGTTQCPNPDNGSYTAGTFRYSYDADGNVLTKVSPAPNQTSSSTTVTLSYTYDALDRLLQKTSSDGTIGSYYLYDVANTNGVVLLHPVGRLSRSNTSLVESLHSYDPMGRVISDYQTTPMHNQIAFTLSYGYDFLGDMTSYTNGMGVSFGQVFDPAARLTQVTTNYVNSPSTIAQSFTYAPTGAITGMSYGTNNVVAETRAYNNRLQTTQIWTYLTSTQTSVQNNSIGYSAPNGQNNGNVYLWDFYSAYDGGIGASPRTYTYDRLNRLSSLSSAGDTSGCFGLNWTYDSWGNRTGQTTTPTTGGSCPNFNATFSQNTNRMDSYSYDAAGNLLNDGTHSYTYDAENHITKVNGGATASYIYDADGRRVEKTTNQGTTEKIYDLSGNVIADWQATGQMQGGWSVGYLYLAGRLAATFENSTTYFVGTDHLGSARGLVDANGNIVDGYHYLPFGELLQGGIYTTHKFTGYERDSETGLDNAQARYYGSSMGHFMIPDPDNAGAVDENPQSWNGYAYVGNNPLSLTDRFGLAFWVCISDGNGGQNCTQYENDQDFYRDAAASHATLSGGNIYTKDVNGNSVQVGTYQHYGSGSDSTLGVPEDDIIAPTLAGGLLGGLQSGIEGIAEEFAGNEAKSVVQTGIAASQQTIPAGAKTLMSGTKAAARAVVDSLANDAQKAALKRTLNRAGSNAIVTLEQLPDGSIKVLTQRAGAFGYQVVEKVIGSDGITKSVLQTAYDGAGKLVHVDVKY